MKKYDIIVIGSGSGIKISTPAAKMGYKVALIESGPLGGTCLNRGCIPSKMLIHHADLMREIKDAKRFHISLPEKAIKVNWAKIIKDVNDEITADSKSIEPALNKDPNRDWYKDHAYFVSDKVVQVGKNQITADKIFIVAGARPFIPPIEGLSSTPYITSTEALKLKKQPKKMIILGGGHIACELAHFYGALGTEVHLIVRSNRLLGHSDTETAAEFARVFTKYYKTHFDHTPTKVMHDGKNFTVYCDNHGKKKKLTADQLLVVTGVQSNTDQLKLASNTNIKLDERGYIKVDNFFKTNVEGVYAYGDIIGRYQLRHAANHEGERLFKNLFGEDKNKPKPMNYLAMPDAVFSYPRVAGVGQTEDELRAEGVKYLVAKRNYINNGYGQALKSNYGFVKILIEADTKLILGAHIVGPDAPHLIHELVYAIRNKAKIDNVLDTIHIHPTLAELIPNAIKSIL